MILIVLFLSACLIITAGYAYTQEKILKQAERNTRDLLGFLKEYKTLNEQALESLKLSQQSSVDIIKKNLALLSEEIRLRAKFNRAMESVAFYANPENLYIHYGTYRNKSLKAEDFIAERTQDPSLDRPLGSNAVDTLAFIDKVHNDQDLMRCPDCGSFEACGCGEPSTPMMPV